MRSKNPMCVRCGIRPKSKTYRVYCLECGREISRALYRERAKRRRKDKTCPLCGAPPAPHHMYCAKCSALPERVRNRLMAEKREKQKSKEVFCNLRREAQEINWRYVRGCGICMKPSDYPKREPELSDFIGRSGEPSIFEHM